VISLWLMNEDINSGARKTEPGDERINLFNKNNRA
jgi:hypothetical protein